MMYFFTELQTETGIHEALLYKHAVGNEMKIISAFCKSKFLGFGVSDKDAEIIIKNNGYSMCPVCKYVLANIEIKQARFDYKCPRCNGPKISFFISQKNKLLEDM